MRVHHDPITGGFDPLHGFNKNISGNCADNILGPLAAITAKSVAYILELPSSVISKNDRLAPHVFDLDIRERKSELATGRQLQEQKSAGTFKGHAAAPNDTTTHAYGIPGSAIDVGPEVTDPRMLHTPGFFELLDFIVGEAIRFELRNAFTPP